MDDGSGFTDLTNAAPYANVTTNTLTVNAQAAANGYAYRCVVSADPGCPALNSDPAILTVPSPLTNVPISADVIISHGDNASFTVSPVGGMGLHRQGMPSTFPSLTYTVNPGLIGSDVFTGSMDRDPAFTDDETVLSPAPVASTSAVPTNWPGDYPITIADGSSGNYTFNYVPAKLTVEAILLSVDQQPADSRIRADERATFSTSVTVTPSIAPVDYQWQYSADGLSSWTDLSQGHSNSYQTRNNSSTGFFRCKHHPEPLPTL